MDPTLHEIALEGLAPHPENSNYMSAETLRKLRHHIERTGRYEPLTVRPHPRDQGKFEVLNGHNRLRVLRAIGHQSARCVVWDVDDEQARLYLATLNRLAGSEIPERRAVLLESLLATSDIEELSLLLPDDKRQLEELKRLSRLEPEEIVPLSRLGKDDPPTPVILEFLLDEAGAKEVNLALDVVQRSRDEEPSRSRALLQLARYYLRHCQPARGKA
jgi:ParB-like chromosome segregation protein Spo0J